MKKTLALLLVPLGLLVGSCSLLPEMCNEEAVSIEGFSAEAAKSEAKLLAAEVRSLSDDFGYRYYDEDGNMAKVRSFIRSKFLAAGAMVQEQEYSVEDRNLYNVRGFFGDRSMPRIVVGAHYESCGTISGENPGADDNASGVAGLFGLAPNGNARSVWAAAGPPNISANTAKVNLIPCTGQLCPDRAASASRHQADAGSSYWKQSSRSPSSPSSGSRCSNSA